jgi:hypothetical protein
MIHTIEFSLCGDSDGGWLTELTSLHDKSDNSFYGLCCLILEGTNDNGPLCCLPFSAAVAVIQ